MYVDGIVLSCATVMNFTLNCCWYFVFYIMGHIIQSTQLSNKSKRRRSTYYHLYHYCCSKAFEHSFFIQRSYLEDIQVGGTLCSTLQIHIYNFDTVLALYYLMENIKWNDVYTFRISKYTTWNIYMNNIISTYALS